MVDCRWVSGWRSRRSTRRRTGRRPRRTGRDLRSGVCGDWLVPRERDATPVGGRRADRVHGHPDGSAQGSGALKYALQTRGVLRRVWAVSGGQCGKYLAVSLPALLDSLEARRAGARSARLQSGVRTELEAMSAATMDRYLAPRRRRPHVIPTRCPKSHICPFSSRRAMMNPWKALRECQPTKRGHGAHLFTRKVNERMALPRRRKMEPRMRLGVWVMPLSGCPLALKPASSPTNSLNRYRN